MLFEYMTRLIGKLPLFILHKHITNCYSSEATDINKYVKYRSVGKPSGKHNQNIGLIGVYEHRVMYFFRMLKVANKNPNLSAWTVETVVESTFDEP